MAVTNPGSGPNLIRDAHTHAVAATELWKAYVAGLAAVTTRTPTEQAREDNQRKRETDYSRGILGLRDER
jgi:hypothetical protein